MPTSNSQYEVLNCMIKSQNHGSANSLTLHCRTSSSIRAGLLSQIYWFIHPVFHLPLVVQQTRHLTFKKTLQLIRMAKLTAVSKRIEQHLLFASSMLTPQTNGALTCLRYSPSQKEEWRSHESGERMDIT